VGFIKRILNKLTGLIAWVSFILAVVGGLAATGSFIGTIIVKIVQIGPWVLPFPLIGVGLLLILGDIIFDGIPNRMAVYLAIVWPSFFLAIPDGKARQKMSGWIDDLNHWLDKHIAVWIGHGGANAVMTATAVTCIAMSIVWAHRYAQGKKSSRSSTNAGGGSPTGRPTARTTVR
jgi:hypothetical protein